jgi:hypothetical protein
MAVAVTTALVLLAVLIDSDVSRVALPVIAGAAHSHADVRTYPQVIGRVIRARHGH